MKERFLRAWVASIPGIGPKRFDVLESIFPDLRVLLAISEPELEAIGIPDTLIHSIQLHQQAHSPEEIEEYCEKKKVKVLLPAEYPPLLRTIEDPPIVLYQQGRGIQEKEQLFAVVGTRHVTPYGVEVTQMLTSELVGAGFTIVSGFMYGVDAVAHRCVIDHEGKTAGVLGFGFEFMYPASHRSLANEMIETGNTLYTEFAPWVAPTPRNFPARNRIVSGMSLGVLVTEAAKKSGSKITASCAIEQGRSVFAVPGSITSVYSEGTKELVNMGAKLVTSVQDIIEDLSNI